jgi:hypothetical protein
MSMSKERNSLICFTNCALALEDGSIVRRDLWIDEAKGVIVDAQVSWELDKYGVVKNEERQRDEGRTEWSCGQVTGEEDGSCRISKRYANGALSR